MQHTTRRYFMSPGEPIGSRSKPKSALELELEGAEAEERADERAAHPFGENPDGLGPTLGENLGKPNPGKDLTPEVEGEN
jgi:hypothetical protein